MDPVQDILQLLTCFHRLFVIRIQKMPFAFGLDPLVGETPPLPQWFRKKHKSRESDIPTSPFVIIGHRKWATSYGTGC